MKNILVISLIYLGIFIFNNSYAKATQASLDQIIAVVNDDVITQTELNHAITIAKTQITQQHMSLPAENVLQKQVLDQLINKRLQLQMAKQVGINIADMEIDNAVQSVANQNNMSVKAVYQRINSDGMSTSDYRNEMRDQMTLQKLQQQEVVSRITISPEEVNSFINSKIWQNNGSKEYHLEDILIPVSDTPSSEEIATARRRAEVVIAKLHNGQNFYTVAQSESADKNALKGGDLGWRKLPEIPSAFAEQVVHLQPKEIGGPIQTSNGFHIIRLAEVRSAQSTQAAPDKKQIQNLLLQRKFEEAVQNWVSKLRSQAFINITKES